MRKSRFSYKRLWMVMIFKQFMTGYCCEMFIKFKFVVVIFFVLPLLGSSSNVRKRRRPTVDEQYKDQDGPFPDQIALATSFEPDRLVSASFSASKEPGNFRHGNFVINLIKSNSENEPKSSNIYLMEETLADSESAQEYVTKALQLKLGIEPAKPIIENNEIPKSTFAKYEVYETQTEETPEVIEKDSVTRSGYDNMQYVEESNSYYKPPNRYTGYTTERNPQMESKKYMSTSTKPRMQQFNDHHQESTNIVPKAEIFKHIEESVMKYMKGLEAEGKLTPPAVTKEPKIYYKIQELPSEPHKTTTVRPKPNTSFNYTPMKSDFQKPETSIIRSQYKESSYKDQDYRETPAYKEVSYQPGKPMQDVIDNLNQNIAFVYKKATRSNVQNRGPASFDHLGALKNIQSIDIPYVILPEEKPIRQKLFFNSDTYHDINSLPFQAEKQLYRPTETKDNEYTRPEHREESNHNQQEQSTSRPYVILKAGDDGYPLNNPYQYVYNQNPAQTLQSQTGSWHPYSPTKSTYSQDLASAPSVPYDSYNPKYNNNPEGDGYQNNYKPHEIYLSPSLTRPQKNENNSPKRGKRGGNLTRKGKNASTQGRKNNEPKRVLRPPPYKTKE